jgi:hypothetical protein
VAEATRCSRGESHHHPVPLKLPVRLRPLTLATLHNHRLCLTGIDDGYDIFHFQKPVLLLRILYRLNPSPCPRPSISPLDRPTATEARLLRAPAPAPARRPPTLSPRARPRTRQLLRRQLQAQNMVTIGDPVCSVGSIPFLLPHCPRERMVETCPTPAQAEIPPQLIRAP